MTQNMDRYDKCQMMVSYLHWNSDGMRAETNTNRAFEFTDLIARVEHKIAVRHFLLLDAGFTQHFFFLLDAGLVIEYIETRRSFFCLDSSPVDGGSTPISWIPIALI